MKAVCTICKKSFEVSLRRVKIAKYCSRKCSGLSKKGKPAWNKGIKRWWNSPTEFQKSHEPWNKNKKGIHLNPDWEFKKGRIGWNKGKKGLQVAWNKGLNKFNTPILDKMGFKKGSECSSWRGGVSSENMRIRKSAEHRAWSKTVFERDDYICQICFIKGGHLHANHIKKFSKYKELRFKLTNGITLCKNCHMEKVNHHEEEWEEYFNKKIKKNNLLVYPVAVAG